MRMAQGQQIFVYDNKKDLIYEKDDKDRIKNKNHKNPSFAMLH